MNITQPGNGTCTADTGSPRHREDPGRTRRRLTHAANPRPATAPRALAR